MHQPQPVHVHVQKVALMVTNCLIYYISKQLSVDVVVTIRVAWWLYPYQLLIEPATLEKAWCFASPANPRVTAVCLLQFLGGG